MGQINAGELRTRLEVQQLAPAQTPRGQSTGQWDTTGHVWAKVEPIGGAEIENARKLFAQATHRVTVRAIEELTTQRRFKLGNRVLNIGRIDQPREAGDAMVILCGEDAS